ncbi:hypothetical protein BDV25DRAFT_167697 [Aspergillus avenaceus]|uniref:Serine protein kinase n=1 Tax=Aspergillus avenaceus TaxID=36643 RepID=A0A5N6U9E3_ASPAV|nr:hypothetical protein BDV25DRAFT_167697 [Aspergillus avenaceus]
MAVNNTYPNDDYVRYKKDDLTIILDTTEGYEIGSDFGFDTSTCLVYAETVNLKANVRIPGKSLGLFCSKINIPESVTLDVSGENGKVGDQKIDADGGTGTSGKNAGDVWIFVQDFEKGNFDNLTVKAHGGDGGRGGNTSGLEKTGGKGGDGGNGGLVEVSLGTLPMEAALRPIEKLPWPEQVANLLQPLVSDALAGKITAEQQATLASYKSLASAIAELAGAVQPISTAGSSNEVKTLASQVFEQIKRNRESVDSTPVLTEGSVDKLHEASLQIISNTDVASGLQKAKGIMETLKPVARSSLSSLLDRLWRRAQSENSAMESDIFWRLKNNTAGGSGPGGDSGPGILPGPRGNKGQDGVTKLKFLTMDGSREDADVAQAYIFPEQCQMLLNKVDSQFFSAQWKTRSPVIKQYEHLVKRLNVVDALSDKGQSSGLKKALDELEKKSQVTRNSKGQLTAIAGQAKNMFGHSQDWDRLKVLKEVEDTETQYKEAFQQGANMDEIVKKGIKKMADTESEANMKINLLTGTNGSLSQTADRITELSVQVKEKRQTVQNEVGRVTFTHHLGSSFLLDAFSTLKKLVNLGKDIYKASQANTYVIKQLAECTGTLESLEMDDPQGLKVMAKAADIEKLMQSFKDSIPAEQRQKVDKALDEYKKVILLRNNAVVDYNSSVQLLVEARHDQKKLSLDPTIPAVSFWLRRTRDNLRLQLMQRLDYARRAVKYWGLEAGFNFAEPGPLRSSKDLEINRLALNGNVRSTWPATENQQGLFYDLSGAQLASLIAGQQESRRTGKVYKVSISLEPKAMPFGGGRADVRLSEVRLWLVGASVDSDGLKRQRLLVHIQHMGDDVFEDANEERFAFTHDMVSIPFEYDVAKVKSKDDFTHEAKLNRANALQGAWTGDRERKDSTIAAIGPFATWNLVVRESENPGLNMANVKSAHIEFCGANRSFK